MSCFYSWTKTRGSYVTWPFYSLHGEVVLLHHPPTVSENVWQPGHISTRGPGISNFIFYFYLFIYLFIANDALLLTKAHNSQIRLISNILSVSCRASGLKVNYERSLEQCALETWLEWRRINAFKFILHFNQKPKN